MRTRSRLQVVGVFLAFGWATTPSSARADGTLTPYAAADIEHDTNVFDLSRADGPPPTGKHGPTYGDTFFEERAGAEGDYYVDQQKFFGTAEFRHFNYDNFTVLNHNEELIDGGLKYKLTIPVDGQIEYKHEQRMVQFQDLEAASTLTLETENTGSASINVTVTPEWRVESLLKDHILDSPRSDVPGLSLHEDSVQEGLKYLGVSNLAAGAQFGYLEGKYNHDPLALNPNYHQWSGSLAATYIISGLTNFNGVIGYTKRTDPTTSGLSGLTGSVGYQHNLSARTSLNVLVSRAINTYITTGGNEIDTSAGATLNYQLTYKILVRAGYTYTNSKFPGQSLALGTTDRIDHFQNGTFDVTYQVLHWLSIRPYARYQSRSSNDNIFTFQGNTVGVELLFKKPPPNR